MKKVNVKSNNNQQDNNTISNKILIAEGDIKDLLSKIEHEKCLRKHFEKTSKTLEHKILLVKNQEKQVTVLKLPFQGFK